MGPDTFSSDDFFDQAPVSMWLEDYSALKRQFDLWRAAGVVDLAAFLEANPQETIRCWQLVNILRINRRTLDMFAAHSAADLEQHISVVLHSSDPAEATYPLIQLWQLAPGETRIQTESVNTRLDGQRLDARINAVILPGHEQTWSRVLSTIEDITQLRASQNTLVKLTDQLPGVMFRSHIARDGSQQYLFISAGVEDLLGISREQVLRDRTSLLSQLHPDDREDVTQRIMAKVDAMAPLDIECRTLRADGSTVWLQLRSKVESHDEFGTVRVGLLIDITERKQAELQLRDLEGRWRRAMAATGDGMWEWTARDGERLFIPDEGSLLGYSAAEVATMFTHFRHLIHPDDQAQQMRDQLAYDRGHTDTYHSEFRLRCKDGSYRWLLSRGVAFSRDANGKPTHMCGTYIDISERKRAEQLIWQQAHFDPLTGLPNRRMLRDRMEREILRCKREGLQFALLVLDLDNFKEVNDTLGHAHGDQLLTQAAQRIRDCVRETDTVARMGGDEFIVLVSDLPDAASLERILTQTLQALSLAFDIAGEQVFVSASIGITTYPDDGTDADTLLRNGDQALYAAKGGGRNRFSFFTPALQAATLHRVRLANDLRGALERGELSLVFQPIVHLATGQVHKAEALLRWQHPVRGPVSPAEFIPIAESTGLIAAIGDWVFEQAALQAQRLQDQSGRAFQVSINRSPVQFHVAHQPSQGWDDRLRQLGVAGSAIAIEITEGLLLDDSPGIKDQLLAMRTSGMEVSLDDFGTGYSSLSYLQRYQIDYVKIDQSFVRHLQPDSTGLALCKAIVVMAHVLGLRVVAEGVETAAQRELLMAMGCDYAQGYFFAHPMTAPVLENFVADLQPQRT